MFISVPLLGHTNQMIALAQELASRGHIVSFLIYEEVIAWLSNTNLNRESDR